MLKYISLIAESLGPCLASLENFKPSFNPATKELKSAPAGNLLDPILELWLNTILMGQGQCLPVIKCLEYYLCLYLTFVQMFTHIILVKLHANSVTSVGLITAIIKYFNYKINTY